ncbi:hypothetical protein SASPL_112449 [Salvia splendens]|uniref:Glutathione reductase n=1 Tax=Salvia splendens TaxID=180675 RepID=A0A8X8Y931_SALSN|nr:hypothetical protein SASPL_112449 [Salvia splendens]
MYLSWTWVFWPWAAAIAIGAYDLYSLSRHLKGEATLAEQLAIVTSTLTWLTLVPPAHFTGGGVCCGLREADRHLEVIVKSRPLSRSDRCSFDRFFSFGGRRAGSTRCICGAGSPVAAVRSWRLLCLLDFLCSVLPSFVSSPPVDPSRPRDGSGRRLYSLSWRSGQAPSVAFATRLLLRPMDQFSFLIKSEGSLLVHLQQDRTQASEVESHYDFDLFVIGAGSGGVRASRFSAQNGAKVGICELPFHPISSEVIGGVGGTCVIRGCVPKKILVYGASFGPELEDARNYGWDVNERIDFNWKKLLQKKTKEIHRLNGIYKRLLSGAGVKLFEGEGRVIGPNEVEVIQLDGTKISYSAKYILIATGSRAQRPPIPGQELGITSDEALSLEELPKHAVILGGGYIAVEFASIWRGMGAKVDLFYRKELPLRGFDNEMREVVAKNLEGRGVNLHPGTSLSELAKTEGGIKVRTDHGEEIVADVVLFATGRAPNSKRLNLEAVGVELDKAGAIKVNQYSQTNVPSIWAIGDVTNRMNLTPVALMEGTYFANTVFGGKPMTPDYSNIACAVFWYYRLFPLESLFHSLCGSKGCSIPPLSVVGLSEQEAVEKANGDILIFTSTFNPMKNTISGRQEKTMMKLIVDAETDKVLGASMCGPDAAEIMQGIAIALKCGATKAQFDSTVGIHPSAAEEFVTMRSVTRRVSGGKPRTNL